MGQHGRGRRTRFGTIGIVRAQRKLSGNAIGMRNPKGYCPRYYNHLLGGEMVLETRAQSIFADEMMMWLFDPEIARVRKTHHILIRFVRMDGLTFLEKRTGKLVKTFNPETRPFDTHKPPSVEIEYTDNRRKRNTTRVTVDCIAALNPRKRCKLLIVSGLLKGAIVRHMKTLRDNIYVKHLDGGKSFILPKSILCPISED